MQAAFELLARQGESYYEPYLLNVTERIDKNRQSQDSHDAQLIKTAKVFWPLADYIAR